MKFIAKFLVLPAVLTLGSASMPAQAPPQGGFTDAEGVRIAQQVQKRLLGLSEYGVFDDIHFGLRGGVVTLGGYASRPTLKVAAERVVKGIEGVKQVENNIEVLPTSQNDDEVRAAVYSRIYSQPALRKYTSSSPMAPNQGFASRTGGISLNPPTGYHAIHIIVKQGAVTLVGAVNDEGDSAIAQMQAHTTPGVFSVDNNLVIVSQQNRGQESSR